MSLFSSSFVLQTSCLGFFSLLIQIQKQCSSIEFVYVILYVNVYFFVFYFFQKSQCFCGVVCWWLCFCFSCRKQTFLKYVTMVPHMELKFPVLGSFWFSVCCAVCTVHVLRLMEQASGRKYVLLADLSVKNIAQTQTRLLKCKMPFHFGKKKNIDNVNNMKTL